MVTITTILALIPVLVALLGLLVAIQNNVKQLNVQSFIKFTERYDIITKEMPEVWQDRRKKSGIDYESTELLLDGLKKYTHFCSQEFYLYIRGHISIGIWSIWENEIEQTFQGQLLMNEWNRIKSEFSGYPEFYDYVSSIQKNIGEKRIADKYCTGINGLYIRFRRSLGINQPRI